MAKTARDVMSGGAECIGDADTVADAARRLAELDVGAMPICGEDDRLKGMLTDRDIVVKVIARARTRRVRRPATSPTSPRSSPSARTTPWTRPCGP